MPPVRTIIGTQKCTSARIEYAAKRGLNESFAWFKLPPLVAPSYAFRSCPANLVGIRSNICAGASGRS